MKENQQVKSNTIKADLPDPQACEKFIEEEFLNNCNPQAECEKLIREGK